MNKESSIEKIHQKFIDCFGSTKNLTILDYGCGTGGLTKILLQQKDHPLNIYSVDIDPKIIEKVNKSFTSYISEKILKTDVINDPKELSGKLFDVIFCHNVLELVNSKEKFVSDLYNLLKENGTLILSHMDFDSIIYNSTFKELTRKLVHSFSDTKQEWMTFSDGQIGRKIPGIIKRTNIQNVSFETWRWTETTFDENDYGFIMTNMLIETAGDKFNKKELKNWKKDLEEKAKSQDYFFAIDIDVAKIRKQN